VFSLARHMHSTKSMSRRVRHCVECPRCHTCYLIAFSPYSNGSYLVHMTSDLEEYTLYCFCDGARKANVCRRPEVKACRVSKPTYERGYGSHDEVDPISSRLHHHVMLSSRDGEGFRNQDSDA
jgi:hypothetical protein